MNRDENSTISYQCHSGFYMYFIKKNIHPYLQLRILTKYHYFLCMCYAKESNFSFKINCTQADFQRLIGNKVRTHTFIQANIPLT